VKVYTFIADTAPEAVAQIRAQLGSEAIVLNVRKVEADGLQKFFKKTRIEVVAHLPESEPEVKADPLQALSELRREIADLRQQMPREVTKVVEPVVIEMPVPSVSKHNYGGWKVGNFLEQIGVLPVHVQRIIDCIEAEHGEKPPESIVKEFDLTRAAVLKLSQRLLTSSPTSNLHVFVGPPASGKTTALSKMLARLALIEGMPARVLRLDGVRANTAESLSVYCEILGVPVERCLTEDFQAGPGETTFIDLPGVSANDVDGLKALAAQIALFPGAQVHLTLNAAYETSTLLSQARAFSLLPITSLVFTHLDEEQRWGKLLNFALGTKFSLGSLSAGQNVPGDFLPATIEKILSRVIPSK
jgi:flagellar biosynthesis protein FlhF